MALIARDGLIITMDPDRRMLAEGSLVVEEGTIVEVSASPTGGGGADTVLDCRGKLILPGLINIHAHTTEVLFRGCATDLPFLQWLFERNHPLLERMSEEDAYLAGLLCGLEMLASGTTCYLDPEVWPQHFDAVARAMERVGLRACLALALEGGTGYTVEDGLQLSAPGGPDGSLAQVEAWHGAADRRLQLWLGPRVLSAVDAPLAGFLRRTAARLGTGITVHFAEVPDDVEQIRRDHNVGPAAYLDRLGLLGPRMILTHAICLEQEDIDAIARSDTRVAHCPASNLKLGNGFAPIPQLLDQGVLVGLGTDGGLCNDSYDLLREMTLAGLIHKGYSGDPQVTPAEKIVEMVTADAARMLNLHEKIGSLEMGKQADITILDLNQVGWHPLHNPIANLVYGSATRGAVETVIVDGRVLLHDRAVPHLDRESILRQAQVRSQAIAADAGLTDAVRSPWQPLDTRRV